MIRQDQIHVFEAGLQSLDAFRRKTKARGRFVALYLGLRRMHNAIAPLGSEAFTPMNEIQGFLDDMFTKTHRPDPLVVLTAPFGGSSSKNAGYSARSGETTSDHLVATNTWRNNLGIQKGIGCPATPAVIEGLLRDPMLRLACPHMQKSEDGQYVCSIDKRRTTYRGEEHSIWLRRTADGYQIVDLDLPNVYEAYLHPHGARIPIFPLIAVLYGLAPETTYQTRESVGIPDFADDFYFTLEQVDSIFDVDPESGGNAPVLHAAQIEVEPTQTQKETGSPRARLRRRLRRLSGNLPPEADPTEMNTGLGAERLVAEQLFRHGWAVSYCGNQRRLGYDLEAKRSGETLYVEVKSSVSLTRPELTESEWAAAQRHGESYALAVVDFYGGDQPHVWYVRDPAGNASMTLRSVSVFRLQRESIEPLGTEAEFL